MKRKSVLFVVLALVLVLNLAACGSKDAEAPVNNSTGTSAPVAVGNAPVAADETPEDAEPTKTPVAPPADGDLPDNAQKATSADLKAIAEGFVGCKVEDLYEAIGAPANSEYGPSCLGEGEDGVLYYDGFNVYTYKNNGVEVVDSVFNA